MSSDPLQHVVKGTPLLEAVTADVLNALKREARKSRASGMPRPSGGWLSNHLNPNLMVLVRNDTGSDLPARSVVRVDDWVVTPATYPFEVADRPVLTASTPTASTNCFGVTRDAIPDGEIGRAILTGVAVVDVLFNSAGHYYADPINGDNTRLTSVTSGAARILKIESSGTTRRALVLLGSEGRFAVEETDGTPSTTTRAKFPVTSLTDNGDGTVTVNVATATLAGLVSQISQTFGGYKTFADGIESDLGITVDNGTATINTDLYVHGVGSQFTIDDYAGSPANLTLLCRATGLYPGGNVFGPEIYATADDAGSTGVMKVVFDLLDTDRRFVIWDSGSMPKIVLTDGSTVAIGATGTLAPGATFVGGIANSVGSGTFATFPADLTSQVTGVLPEANGGTGYSTLAAALDALGGINL